MTYHPVVTQIINLLKEHSMWYETFKHEPVLTSEEAAKVRTGYTLSQGAKALILKTYKASREEEFIMVVVPGDKKFSGSKVKKLLQVKDVRFASTDEISQITNGVEIGGVPPFGNLFNLKVIVDPVLLENEKIIFNAGDRRFSVGMLSKDYMSIVKPTQAPII
ncbi:MAG: YbaK/EbsC family protein [bacterium]|nr:YbaK/EbsC family protein [bacterium]